MHSTSRNEAVRARERTRINEPVRFGGPRRPSRAHLLLGAYVLALAVAVVFGTRQVDAANARGAGGPLSPCPGHAQFSDEYRWTNGRGVWRGCSTGYSTREYLDGGGQTYCGPRLDDSKRTTAVSINVPHLNYPGSRRVRCGLRLLVCGTRCAVVTVTDRGPYVLGSGGDYGRDLDLSVAARAAIGVNVALSSWGDPVQVFYRICSPACVKRNS